MIHKIILEQKITEIADRPWDPIEVTRVNDQVVRLALCRGEYHWHHHTNEDELFYVLRGELIIQLKDDPDLTLREGELTVIPKGVEHCPKSVEDTYILMFEPYALQSQGD
ncbi:MAG: cupin domain-containing protein [Candidatus Heimdallarchaeota archaeon]